MQFLYTNYSVWFRSYSKANCKGLIWTKAEKQIWVTHHPITHHHHSIEKYLNTNFHFFPLPNKRNLPSTTSARNLSQTLKPYGYMAILPKYGHMLYGFMAIWIMLISIIHSYVSIRMHMHPYTYLCMSACLS